MIQVTKIQNSSDLKIWKSIRRSVFMKELGVSSSYEKDPYQKEAHFFLAYVDKKPAGIGRYRLLEEFIKFEWIGTLDTYRKEGVGQKIVTSMLHDALQLYPDHLPMMNARCAVLPFYEKMGWERVGDIFVDENMKHQKMIFPN